MTTIATPRPATVSLLLLSICACFTGCIRTGLPQIVKSPDGSVRLTAVVQNGDLRYDASLAGSPAILPSPMTFTLDGVNLARNVHVLSIEPYGTNERYPWFGTHSVATDHSNGARMRLRHEPSNTTYTLD